jgi:hypothetical protein
VPHYRADIVSNRWADTLIVRDPPRWRRSTCCLPIRCLGGGERGVICLADACRTNRIADVMAALYAEIQAK